MSFLRRMRRMTPLLRTRRTAMRALVESDSVGLRVGLSHALRDTHCFSTHHYCEKHIVCNPTHRISDVVNCGVMGTSSSSSGHRRLNRWSSVHFTRHPSPAPFIVRTKQCTAHSRALPLQRRRAATMNSSRWRRQSHRQTPRRLLLQKQSWLG